MQQNSQPVIAADIGGTHVTVAAVDMRNWQTIARPAPIRRQIDSRAVAKSILSAWAIPFREMIDNHAAGTDPSIGIAIPGPFDYENGISRMKNQDKYDTLYGMNIRLELAERIGVNGRCLRFINDAAAFLQGEVFAGNHNGYAKVLGITLGTGLGSAVRERGHNAVDADLWNTPYRNSSIEEYLVTRWFVRKAAEYGIHVTGFRELLQFRGKQRGEVDDILAEYSDHLLHFIGFFCEQEGTEKIIIGGNIAKAWDILYPFNSTGFNRFDISISQLGEHAALIGAATLFA